MNQGQICKVLLVYKRSARLGRERSRRRDPFIRRDRARFRRAGWTHRRALDEVRRILRKKRLQVKAVYRTKACNYAPFDLVVSVGGDGTFLEAARPARRQWILGVNSDPARSTGSFCRATVRTFEGVLDRLLAGRARVERLNRLSLRLNGRRLGVPVLNDLLVAHRRPAVMSRYWLKVGRRSEQQRSSGLWVATAGGSTGAIRSAGGQRLPRGSQAMQYRPRELFWGSRRAYRLTGGVVRSPCAIRVGSLMHDGVLCIDGDHVAFPFRYGDLLEIRSGGPPLYVVS